MASGLSSLLCPALLEPGKEWAWAVFLLLLGAERHSPKAGGCGSVLLGLGLGECPHTQAGIPASAPQHSGVRLLHLCLSQSQERSLSGSHSENSQEFHPQGKLLFR